MNYTLCFNEVRSKVLKLSERSIVHAFKSVIMTVAIEALSWRWWEAGRRANSRSDRNAASVFWGLDPASNSLNATVARGKRPRDHERDPDQARRLAAPAPTLNAGPWPVVSFVCCE